MNVSEITKQILLSFFQLCLCISMAAEIRHDNNLTFI